jgi:hypothetical protein
VGIGKFFGIEDQLRDAFPVTDIEEYKPAVVSVRPYPPGQYDPFSRIA